MNLVHLRHFLYYFFTNTDYDKISISDIKIIKNEYTKYDSMQQEFMDFYFNTYMTLEQINDETELNEFTDNTIKKYFG